MSNWDNLNINIGHAGMFEEPQATSDSSSEPGTTQAPSMNSNVVYMPMTGNRSIQGIEKKKIPLKDHIQNFFGYLFLFCAVLAVISFISAVVASILEARNIQINCILGFIASIVIGGVSAGIAFHQQ